MTSPLLVFRPNNFKSQQQKTGNYVILYSMYKKFIG